MNSASPNILYIFADQIRACSVPTYGWEKQITTPHLDRLRAEGSLAQNAISSCPLCTPYRAMLLTGRYPQSTGVVVNGTGLHPEEQTIADAFNAEGYQTSWIGKWHLYPGDYPLQIENEPVPQGRDRAGFSHWRGYNFHLNYDDPWLDGTDGRSCYRAPGFEPLVLAEEAEHFMTQSQEADIPFLCCVSSHLGHFTHLRFAPDRYYEGLAELPELPHPINAGDPDVQRATYRHYLAMILALDEMVGQLLDYLDKSGLADNTLVIFTSDHGTEAGAHSDPAFWHKMQPYDTTTQVPWLMRWPGHIEAGSTCETPFTPADILPSLCAATGIAAPKTCEGQNVLPDWLGQDSGRDGVLAANFVGHVNNAVDGKEWRAWRTRTHLYARHLDGTEELYDVQKDPWQNQNLATETAYAAQLKVLRRTLDEELKLRQDAFLPGSAYASWFDLNRRPRA